MTRTQRNRGHTAKKRCKKRPKTSEFQRFPPPNLKPLPGTLRNPKNLQNPQNPAHLWKFLPVKKRFAECATNTVSHTPLEGRNAPPRRPRGHTITSARFCRIAGFFPRPSNLRIPALEKPQLRNSTSLKEKDFREKAVPGAIRLSDELIQQRKNRYTP